MTGTESRLGHPDQEIGLFARHASISIDLDAVEDYAYLFGITVQQEEADRIYCECIERIIKLMAEERVQCTCFVVGRDAGNPARRQHIRQLAEAGHELGNHSFSHHAFVNSVGITADIEKSHRVISELASGPVNGYRSPGYWLTDEAYAKVRKLGYAYDSSAYPALANIPLKLMAAVISRREVPLPVRFCAYGRLANVIAPRNPYYPETRRYWKPGPDRDFVEIPLTILPLLNWPFQFLYLLPFRESALEFLYQRLLPDSFVNFSFHLLDFGGDHAADWLRAIPVMRYSYGRREALARFMLRLLHRQRQLIPLQRLPGLMAAAGSGERC